MTLRDLSKKQLYNLRRKCQKHWRLLTKNTTALTATPQKQYELAFSEGVKAVLAQLSL